MNRVAIIACALLAASYSCSTAQSPVGSGVQADSSPGGYIDFHKASKIESASIPEAALFIGDPFCSEDGTTYLNVRVPPTYSDSTFLRIAGSGDVKSIKVTPVSGLENIHIWNADADSSGVYVLMSAHLLDSLEASSEDAGRPLPGRDASKYHNFVVYFQDGVSLPVITSLDLPFTLLRIAILNRETWLILGMDTINQQPILVSVNHSGKVVRYLDVEDVFPAESEMLAQMPLDIQSSMAALPDSGRLDAIVSMTQFVHYKDALLMLFPSRRPMLAVIQPNGFMTTTVLKLPVGMTAQSLISSDRKWVIRAATPSGRDVIAEIDPSTGQTERVLGSAQLTPSDITCLRGGEYLGIHWVPDKGQGVASVRPYLMVGQVP